MPRKRSRFSRLDAELKASGGTAPVGTRAGDFLNFRKGINKITQPRRPGSEVLARFGVGVLPFGLTPAATTPVYYIASMTIQAEQIRAFFNTAASLNNYGIETRTTATQDATGIFYPAQVKVFITALNAVSTPENSKIIPSADQYRRFKGRSGSIPFGRTITGVTDAGTNAAETALGNVDEEDVKKSLASKLKGQTTTAYRVKGISFVSELWRIGASGPGAKPATLPAFTDPG